jgi:hypothetical protein
MTQVQDKITINVQAFELDAETVTVTSSKDTSHTAQGKFTVQSTDDMSITSQAKFTLQSTKAMEVDTNDDLTISSVKDTKHSAMNTTSQSQVKAEIDAVQITVSGTAKVEVSAPMTNVGQDLTTIKGSLVQVNGQMNMIG